MAKYKIGIIGCGRPRRTENATGFGQAHLHAAGYNASGDCDIVAAADIVQGNLDAFCEQYEIPNGYLDYNEMLAQEDLDIVSVCVWPKLHHMMVVDTAKAGVRAVFCEKPMAPTWGESKEMVAVCEANNVQLAFNHQRRFGAPPSARPRNCWTTARLGNYSAWKGLLRTSLIGGRTGSI